MNRAAAELEACITRARAHLDKARITDQDVHETRRAVKKARAALRLLRPRLPESVYRQENLCLRDAGRLLAPVRDARSQLDALERLPPRFQSLGAGLRHDQVRARAELHEGARRVEMCLKLLDEARARAKGRDVRSVPDAVLEEGLRILYRKGRKALRQAGKARSAASLHEWRKQIKHLSNALEILGIAQRGEGAKALRRAEAVADRLGDDRDLALLGKRHLSEKKLRERIASRREKLQRGIFVAGKKLYAEKPRRFARRLAG